MQYLLGLVVNKNSDNCIRVTFDVGNYREKREETLEKLAKKPAHKVAKNRKSITLEPMNPTKDELFMQPFRIIKMLKPTVLVMTQTER